MKKILFFLLLLPEMLLAQYSLRLPSILSDHMLLQQSAEVKFWGWADPRTTVKIVSSWSKDTIMVTASEKAKWETTVQTPAAGGPYTIDVFTKNKSITIQDVMIGELWLCSGQSNMEYSAMHGVIDAKEEITDCQNNNIRFFFVKKATAEYPQDDCYGYWKVCSPESMPWFSSVGYFFGKKLNEDLNIPIGLINSNWGGTPVETWTPLDKIDNPEKVKKEASGLKKSTGWDNTISSTYNAMIHPILKMKLAGAIWYQGEANCPNAYSYAGSLSRMIRAWREKFETSLPFYYVQIAPYLRYPIPYSAALIREQQEKVQSLDKTGMVVISDLVDDLNNIHPKYKKEVGTRLAAYALAETYGKETTKYKFATLAKQEIEKNRIRVYFNNAENGIVSKGKAIEGLEIAGSDLVFHPANGKIDSKSNTLLVAAKEVKEPLYVRYEFSNGGVGNLFDSSGLPVAPFRTDNVVFDLQQNK
ncbi:sialate O-acetylesterase [uncultured Draconibacterium sp.]|uniref:sialate O-acetylesterase n=1 Tax=uncultured Draconibacterium sp. TaxID=1573823 RepID=UPI0029C7727D|nr:sialate O-acetylesterase [uncultured Draconibacterium sp.]